jgi:AraC-like DNA-binding protein
VSDDGAVVELGPGDVVLARGPEPYTFADRPDTPPTVVVHPGQHCATPGGVPLAQAMSLGVRTWGNARDGGTVLLVGTYEHQGDVSQRLLDALPPFVRIGVDSWECPFVPLLASEIVKDDPGQEVVLDRLLDLLLVAALRAWFSRPEADAPAWFRAHADPVVGRALRMLHADPAHPWTVQALASATGMSRAALARRFTDLVGEPPMAYLTSWRLALAADLLREPGATIGSVAHQVGYGSPFALSAAFKRVRGVSPKDHRATARAG